jgi:short-subunit dehydrogenase
MKILLTGSSSGVGKELLSILSTNHDVDAPDRAQLDVGSPSAICHFIKVPYDMLINCAGTGIGGKIDFINHKIDDAVEILNVNLVGTILLTQQVIKLNPTCKIVTITSTNNNRYWPNDLIYSLSKKSLSDFISMLHVEYPEIRQLEVQLGFTKTKFNENRYKNCMNRFQDIYRQSPVLLPAVVAKTISDVIFDDTVKFIEVSP